MTFPERLLWSKLRNRQIGGWKFRRQHPIGVYTADFACLEAKLVIELDGDSHGTAEGRRHDAARNYFMQSEGWRISRFWNFEIMESLEGVCDAILLTLER